MPTRLDTNFANLTNPDEFESLVRDLCAYEWGDPSTEKFGRKGQKQFGVDVYGRTSDLDGKYRAAQCKLFVQGDRLTKINIEDEVTQARTFPHPLNQLIIATNAPRDSNTQILVDQISEDEIRQGYFRVVIWFWDSITKRLAAYPDLIIRYYRDYYSNLTTLPFIERLVDTPLQILFVRSIPQFGNPLEAKLRFRGIRILDSNDAHFGAPISLVPSLIPDGLVCQYNPQPGEDCESSTKQFVGGLVTRFLHLVDPRCPVFVLIPPELTQQIAEQIESLGNSGRILQTLSDDAASDLVADRIFHGVFDYGYARRGSLSTIEIVARTNVNKPGSALLDMDWCEKLNTNHFPSTEEWDTFFAPALKNVTESIIGLGDRTRIQINSQLPLPAAFALGFHFNLRVARIGLWARRSGVSDFKYQFWLSGGNPSIVKCAPTYVRRGQGETRSAIVELTTFVAVEKSVEVFAKEAGLSADTWLRMQLETEGANIDEGEAVAFANQVGQEIRHLNEQGITDIHLFARIPSALAVLIGQRLQACGHIHLYWYDNSTYRFAFTLK